MYYYKINYVIGAFVTLGVTLLLGSLIFIRGRGGKIVKSYFLLMLSIAAFSFSVCMLLMAKSAQASLYWARFSHIALCFLAVFYFHFVIKLIGLGDKQKILTGIIYGIAGTFSALFLTPYLIKFF